MEKIVDIIENIIFILEGYSIWLWNIIIGKTRQKAIKRLAICNKCEFNKSGKCSLCGCIIKAKVRADFPEDKNGISIDGCPKKKW